MVYRLTALRIMNKKISLKYTTKLNKIGELQRSIFEDLRTDLINMGPQGFVYDDGEPNVPIYCQGDADDGCQYVVDEIKADSKGFVKFHDKQYDDWYILSTLDDSTINMLIEYIDWK